MPNQLDLSTQLLLTYDNLKVGLVTGDVTFLEVEAWLESRTEDEHAALTLAILSRNVSL